MTFLINQPVRSKSTGMRLRVLGWEPETTDGQEVVMVEDTNHNFGPWLANDLEEDLG